MTETSKILLKQKEDIIGCNVHGSLEESFLLWEPRANIWARRSKNHTHIALIIICFLSPRAAASILERAFVHLPYISFLEQGNISKAFASEPLIFPKYVPPSERGGLSVVTGVIREVPPLLDDWLR